MMPLIIHLEGFKPFDLKNQRGKAVAFNCYIQYDSEEITISLLIPGMRLMSGTLFAPSIKLKNSYMSALIFVSDSLPKAIYRELLQSRADGETTLEDVTITCEEDAIKTLLITPWAQEQFLPNIGDKQEAINQEKAWKAKENSILK